MNASQNSNTSRLGRVLRRLAKIVLFTFLILFLFLFLAAGVGMGEIEAFIALTFGWLQFLRRTIPQISWNWDLIGMGILCSGIILFLAHRFFNWFARAQGNKWPWKWTWCGLIAIAILFLVGMSFGGAAHQIGWIAGSNEPLFERKGRGWEDYNNMRQLEMAFQVALEDEKGNLNKIRQDLWKIPNEYVYQSKSLPPIMQAYHLLVVTKDDGTIEGAIIFPRDGQKFTAIGGLCSFGDKNGQPIPIKELHELLQKYQKHLTAL